jgi:hypothetical protein
VKEKGQKIWRESRNENDAKKDALRRILADESGRCGAERGCVLFRFLYTSHSGAQNELQSGL